MYLGAQSRISFTTPGEQTKPPEKPLVQPGVALVNEILQYREVYGDEVWNEFSAWHRAEYLPGWRIRMPFPDPEYYYKTFEDFAVDWATFEDILPPLDVGPDNGDEDGGYVDGGYEDSGFDFGNGYDTGGAEEDESETNWPMMIAIGTGAVALVLLMRK